MTYDDLVREKIQELSKQNLDVVFDLDKYCWKVLHLIMKINKSEQDLILISALTEMIAQKSIPYIDEREDSVGGDENPYRTKYTALLDFVRSHAIMEDSPFQRGKKVCVLRYDDSELEKIING